MTGAPFQKKEYNTIMANRIKKKLNIDKCITISDFYRSEGEDPISNKLKLSIELAKVMKPEKANSIYSRLYRYQKDGFYTEDKKFTAKICTLLGVTNKELVINYDT